MYGPVRTVVWADGRGDPASDPITENDLIAAIRESAQENASRAGAQIVQRNLDIQPTITVRPGWPIRILVNQDIILPPMEIVKR